MTSTTERTSGRRASAAPRKASVVSGIVSGATTALVVVACLLAIALAIVPRLMGGSALTVLTGSMEPTYSPGDMVAVKAANAGEIQVGDVVTFQPNSGDPLLITHRVISKQLGGTPEGTLFVTQGDANDAADEPIVGDQIKGVVMYHVPYIGHAAMAVGEHRQFVVVAAATALLGYGAFMFIRPSAGAKRARNTKEQL